MFQIKYKLLIVGILGGLLSACAQIADSIGYDTQYMNSSAAQSYSKMISQARSYNKIETTTTLAKRVNRIFQRMVPYADAANKTGVKFDWELSVIDKDEANAFAMAGGKMVVYTGIIEKLNLTDDEIAAVIGHEMTHALQEHSKKRTGQIIFTALALEITGAIVQSKSKIDDESLNLYKDMIGTVGMTLPYYRHHEAQADAGGVRLMAQAGYNPEAAVNVWVKMKSYNKLEGRGNNISFLSTHPSNDARIRAIKSLIPKVMPIYEQTRLSDNN